jgi:hypothetical protein
MLRSLVFVKSVHTAIFVFFASCIGLVVHAAITGRITMLTGVAFALVMLEAVIFVGNGWRCPLTVYAERLGAKNGSVADLFVPLWFARRLPWIASLIFGTASSVVLLRLLL